LNRHDKHHVNGAQQGLDRLGGRIGVDYDSISAAKGAYAGQSRGVVIDRLNMYADAAGAGFCERLQITVRLVEHEMHVEEKPRRGAKCGDSAGTKCEVRRKMSVHDVEVYPLQAKALDNRRAVCEARMVARKDGRN
jgi:hypothetical protein